MLSDIPYNYDSSGKLQHSLFCRDVVLCLCYQPPFHTYIHPNTGHGVYSQGVFVVSGEYTSRPLMHALGLEGSDSLSCKANNFYSLEKFKGVPLEDTAGPDGVMMIHFNPLSGSNEFDYQLINNSNKLEVSNSGYRTIIFSIKEGVLVNGVELSLLNRVRVYNNTTVNIETFGDGAAIVLTRKLPTEDINDQLALSHLRQSSWTQFYNRLGS